MSHKVLPESARSDPLSTAQCGPKTKPNQPTKRNRLKCKYVHTIPISKVQSELLKPRSTVMCPFFISSRVFCLTNAPSAVLWGHHQALTRQCRAFGTGGVSSGVLALEAKGLPMVARAQLYPPTSLGVPPSLPSLGSSRWCLCPSQKWTHPLGLDVPTWAVSCGWAQHFQWGMGQVSTDLGCPDEESP